MGVLPHHDVIYYECRKIIIEEFLKCRFGASNICFITVAANLRVTTSVQNEKLAMGYDREGSPQFP